MVFFQDARRKSPEMEGEKLPNSSLFPLGIAGGIAGPDVRLAQDQPVNPGNWRRLNIVSERILEY